MKIEYEAKVTQITHKPKGGAIFCELATVVSIDDEASGEYVSVSQDGRLGGGKISIDPEEWPAIRAVIDRMIAGCQS